MRLLVHRVTVGITRGSRIHPHSGDAPIPYAVRRSLERMRDKRKKILEDPREYVYYISAKMLSVE
jgi:hypothetical protein